MNITKQDLLEEVCYLVMSIRDPEKDQTLGQLSIITQQSISIGNYPPLIDSPHSYSTIQVQIKPTVPHCHLTQQIGLAVRMKLMQDLTGYHNFKVSIRCLPGTHNQQQDINKQINDKERVAAAMENKEIYDFIMKLIGDHS